VIGQPLSRHGSRRGNPGAPGCDVPGWSPGLRNTGNRVNAAILVKL